VNQFSRFALALGLLFALPTVASADLPRSERAELPYLERAKLRRDIELERAKLRRDIELGRVLLQQIKAAQRTGLCIPLDEVRALESTLRDWENAYEQRLPVKSLRR
jgi:hypothetical protein